jgi:peptidoglycan/LPS O-acetylase OafA/YrhL
VLFAVKPFDHRFVAGDDEVNMIVRSLVVAVPAVTALSALTYTVIEAPFLAMRVAYVRKKSDPLGVPLESVQ